MKTGWRISVSGLFCLLVALQPLEVSAHTEAKTNALLNASESLKVMDLSWLDEPPTTNNEGK